MAAEDFKQYSHTKSASVLECLMEECYDEEIKRYVCPMAGCNRNFARRDHLDRHKLNHKKERLKCIRCDSEFARKDLLSRHLRRHEEKDQEAGGRGKGILQTRKRVWDPQVGYISKKKRRASESLVSIGSNSTECCAGGVQAGNSKFQKAPKEMKSKNNSIHEFDLEVPPEIEHTRSFSTGSSENISSPEQLVDFKEPYNLTMLNDYSWILQDVESFMKDLQPADPLCESVPLGSSPTYYQTSKKLLKTPKLTSSWLGPNEFDKGIEL